MYICNIHAHINGLIDFEEILCVGLNGSLDDLDPQLIGYVRSISEGFTNKDFEIKEENVCS